MRKDIKNLYLSVHQPKGEVRVSAPKRMTDEDIRRFVLSKIEWLGKQQAKFKTQEPILEKEYISGDKIYYFGRTYNLVLVEQENKRSKVEIKDGEICLYIKEGSHRDQRANVLKEWYRKELKAIIPSYIEKWEKIMGLTVAEWGVKQMKTRWGTCNPRHRRIWINLELAKRSYDCLEYIIVHEMAHLIEKGHGERFKAIMDQYYPNWRTIKKELNNLI